MSRQQKGRRHRTVNRRPRPVGSGTPRLRGPAVRAGEAPAGGASASGAPTGGAASVEVPAAREEAGPLFSHASKDGGLGLPAARTWRQLALAGAAGATVEDLSATVGYQPPTIVRHLRGLSRYGMADQQGSRWRLTGKSQWDAAAEHGLPSRPTS